MEVREQVMPALGWATIARFGTQLLSWAFTIVVIRVLTPEDYGLIAMVVVVTSFLVLLNSCGQDAVLVQKHDLTETERRQIFAIVICINLIFFSLLELTAPAISYFYNEPRLTDLLRVLALQFVVLIFETLPQSRLERDLSFKGRSIVDLIATIVGSISTLMLALLGHGVWALVWGSLLTTTSRVVGLNVICPCPLSPKWALKGLRKSLSFGGFVTAERGLWFVFNESDKFIGGKVLGPSELGIYAVAHQLASLPIQKLTGVLNAVAFPAFSQAHAKSDYVGEYLLKATRLIAMIAFPFFLGVSSIAAEIVKLLLGATWVDVALALQLLALVMPLRMLGNLFAPVLFGVGRPEVSATNSLLAAVLLPALFLVGAQWGTVGLCMAWVIGYPVLFVVVVQRACRCVGVSFRAYSRQLAWPAILSIAMYVAVSVARTLLPDSTADLVKVIELVVIGAVFYVSVLWIFNRESIAEVRGLLRRNPRDPS